jgi:hypothetical protein
MQMVAQPPTHFHLPGLRRPHDERTPAPEKQPTPAVIFDATKLGSPLLLDKGWRVGITANSAAANPDFDDSAWAVRDAQDTINEIPDEDQDSGKPDRNSHDHVQVEVGGQRVDVNPGRQQRFAWFRLHIQLAPDHGPVALYIELPVPRNTSFGSSTGLSVDVFANGRQIQAEGPHGDEPQHYQQISRIYDLKLAPTDTSLVLAVRTIFIPFGYGAYTSFFSGRKLSLGRQEDLERQLELWSAHGLFERVPRLVTSILLLVLALFLLALYFSQKGHVEYLWLALHELLQSPIAFVDLLGSSARMDQLWYAAIVVQLLLLSAYFYFEFLISFLSLRRRWYTQFLRYTSPILILFGPLLLMVRESTAVGIVLALVVLATLIWMLGWSLFVVITLIAASLRRNFEAGLLLIPLILSVIGIAEPVMTAGMSQWVGHEYHSPLTIQAGPIPIHFASIADSAGIIVIVLIIFGRFLRIQRSQERVSSELAAARSVQELMIPQEKLETPGFEVDSIYNPANEVGGDFFHVETIRDGGLLVVIGDVAGKGLKAAMNVSMLMGALRRTVDRSPAKVLESLNRVLVGSESFTTCQAAWFGSNGELVLANAGHLPPYLNSQEIFLPPALPLGVLADNTYDEIRLYLHPGDRILLMSDGVVEARGPSGELFGFERVHNLSNQSAFYIADAAKTFGQEDDITVLTVRRLSQAMAAA